MKNFRTEYHAIYTKTINKVALSRAMMIKDILWLIGLIHMLGVIIIFQIKRTNLKVSFKISLIRKIIVLLIK